MIVLTDVVKAFMAPGEVPGSSGTRNLHDNLADLRAQVAANQKVSLLGWGSGATFIELLKQKNCLKTLNTIGNGQRLVFSLAVSQHIHKEQTCENLSSIGRRSCKIIMKEKHACHTKLCA